MSDLSILLNNGKALAPCMSEAGINTARQLEDIGAKTAFLRVKAVFPDACINHLYAIEGAFQGIRWHYLSEETKQDLKAFAMRYNDIFRRKQ